MTDLPGAVERSKVRRALVNRAFAVVCVGIAALSVLVLGTLLTVLLAQGARNLAHTRVEVTRTAADGKVTRKILGEDETTSWTDGDGREVVLRATAEGIEVEEAGGATRLVTDDATLADSTSIRFLSTFEELRLFMTSPPSRYPALAGIGPAMWGTIFACLVCALTALPIGVGTAIFLEEYKPKRRIVQRLHGFLQLNIANLAGVPSIVYGILGLTVFVQMFGLFGSLNEPSFTVGDPRSFFYFQLPFGRSVLAGGLTLMLVVLPVVIVSSQEALRAVPNSLREGALATGATRWQMIWRMTLPAAIPGIMTGSILSISRAIGEAAPILVIAGIVYIRFRPANLLDDFTAMPLQIYDWAGRPQDAFRHVAAHGIIVLLVVLLSFNAFAVFIRQKFQKHLQ